jgi:hypothetical protein
VGPSDIIVPVVVADAASCVSLCYTVHGCIASHFEDATRYCSVMHTISTPAAVVDDVFSYRFCRKTFLF